MNHVNLHQFLCNQLDLMIEKAMTDSSTAGDNPDCFSDMMKDTYQTLPRGHEEMGFDIQDVNVNGQSARVFPPILSRLNKSGDEGDKTVDENALQVDLTFLDEDDDKVPNVCAPNEGNKLLPYPPGLFPQVLNLDAPGIVTGADTSLQQQPPFLRRGWDAGYAKLVAPVQPKIWHDVDLGGAKNDPMTLGVDLGFLDTDDPVISRHPECQGTLPSYLNGLHMQYGGVGAPARENTNQGRQFNFFNYITPNPVSTGMNDPLQVPRCGPIAPPKALYQPNHIEQSDLQRTRPGNPLGRSSSSLDPPQDAPPVRNNALPIANLLNASSDSYTGSSSSGHHSRVTSIAAEVKNEAMTDSSTAGDNPDCFSDMMKDTYQTLPRGHEEMGFDIQDVNVNGQSARVFPPILSRLNKSGDEGDKTVDENALQVDLTFLDEDDDKVPNVCAPNEGNKLLPYPPGLFPQVLNLDAPGIVTGADTSLQQQPPFLRRGWDAGYAKLVAPVQPKIWHDVDLGGAKNDPMTLGVDLGFLDTDDPVISRHPECQGTLPSYLNGLHMQYGGVGAPARENTNQGRQFNFFNYITPNPVSTGMNDPLQVPRCGPIAPPKALYQPNHIEQSDLQRTRPGNPLGRSSSSLDPPQDAPPVRNNALPIANLLNASSDSYTGSSSSGHHSRVTSIAAEVKNE
ncbi:hypothetical protein BKA69DRAFT_1042873, partial [Paraphysoderma sedebokerense]